MDILTNYITIQGWMITELHLQDTELLLYALIYGFSQDGKSSFKGSTEYMGIWTGKTRPTVIKALSNLVAKKLIGKIKTINQTGYVCEYRNLYNHERVLNNLTGGVKNLNRGVLNNLTGGVKNFNIGCKESLHNNNIYNIDYNNKEQSTKTSFSNDTQKNKNKSNSSKKVLFKNSEIYKLVKLDEKGNIIDLSKLKEKFQENGMENIDFAYYFSAISDWSLQKNVKRTNNGWLATFRTFIRRDSDAKKLHKINSFNQPDFDLHQTLDNYNL